VTHHFLVGWLTIALLSGAAIVSPGPNYAVTLKYSLLHSRRAGIWSAVGVAGGNLVHVVLSLLGLAVIVSQSVLLLSTLKWVGAAYLVYLGLKSLKAGKYEADGTEQTGGADGSEDKGAARVLRGRAVRADADTAKDAPTRNRPCRFAQHDRPTAQPTSLGQ